MYGFASTYVYVNVWNLKLAWYGWKQWIWIGQLMTWRSEHSNHTSVIISVKGLILSSQLNIKIYLAKTKLKLEKQN